MNLKVSKLFSAITLSACSLAVALTACELIAPIDRSLIHEDAGLVTVDADIDGGTDSGPPPECKIPADCTPPSNECVQATCTDGKCGTSNVADATPVKAQVAGDCLKLVCDGKGTTRQAVDTTDSPDDNNACTTDSCDSNGAGVHTPTAGSCTLAGNAAVCGAPASAAKGTCVACNVTADCKTAGTVCDAITNASVPKCVALSCTDGIMDGSETDKDCGGSCAACPNTKGCGVAGDCASGFCNGTVCAACTTNGNCAGGQFCDIPNGVCKAKIAAGNACTGASQCTSGVCGVNGTGNCCAAACTTGDATCGATSCSAGTGTCVYPSASTPCRAAAGACDVAETCTGVGTCPADAFLGVSTVCRASAGVCDVAENCTGASAACPGDTFAGAGTSCRPAADVCDLAETCTGSAAACPADAFKNASTQCRASAGACDVAENCTGSGAACPADAFASAATVCRASAGVCDVAENCTGSAASCPADAFAGAATVCRAAAGVCDLAENCSGGSAACPADAVMNAGTTCGVTTCTTAATTMRQCNGTLTSCIALAPVSCAGGLTCADGTNCRTACGADIDCAGTGFYCANPGALGVCAPQGITGTPCTADNECLNGTCVGAPAGNCN